MFQRIIEKSVRNDLFKGKIVLIYGPRQVGKTTLVQKILKEFEGKGLYFDCQNQSVHSFLIPDPVIFKQKIGNASLVVLDEAQYIPDTGRVLKVLHDACPEVQLLVTGSSSFDLANKTNESLAGRTREHILFPISVEEILTKDGPYQFDATLETLFRFGTYPGIMGHGETDMARDLETLQSAVLYKDMLALDGVKKPKLLVDLLKALALQVGSEVSNSSLSNLLDASIQTVDRYIDILEKMFIVKRLYALSRNPRVEIRKGYKVYFLDLGIRNSIIQNHNPLAIRNDKGALFENFFIIERLKYLKNHSIGANTYFWRTQDQKELDYIEEHGGSLSAFECAFSEKSIALADKKFRSLHANVDRVQLVTPRNMHQWLS